MDSLDRHLHLLTRRHRLERTVRQWSPLTSASLAVAATMVMVVRLAVPDMAWTVGAIAAAGALAALVMVPRWWRQTDRSSAIAGELDLHLHADGLAMALAAQPTATRDPQWMTHLEPALRAFQAPPFAWGWAKGPVAAAACLAIALALPQADEAVTIPTTLANLFRQVHEKTDAAAETMTPQRNRELLEELAALERHARDSGMDQATWQALDRLSAELAGETAEAGKRLTAALTAAESAGSALASAHDADGGAAQASKLVQALAELAKQAPKLVPVLPAGDAAALTRALAQAVAQGQLTPEQQAALARAGLDPGAGGVGGAMDAQQLQALSERLQQELAKGRAQFDTWQERAQEGEPGVEEGPGHAPLSYGDIHRVDPGYQAALPSGARLNADGSVTIAEQARDAELDDAAKDALLRAAARSFDPTAADARRAAVSPRHRATVEHYFSSTQPSDERPPRTAPKTAPPSSDHPPETAPP